MLHPHSVELTPDDLDLLERAYELRLADDQWITLLRLAQRIRLSLEREHFWACPYCGCTDVETLDWVAANTNTPTDEGVDEDEPYYCPSCDARMNGPLAKVAAPRPYDPTHEPAAPAHLPGCQCAPCRPLTPETEPQPEDT